MPNPAPNHSFLKNDDCHVIYAHAAQDYGAMEAAIAALSKPMIHNVKVQFGEGLRASGLRASALALIVLAHTPHLCCRPRTSIRSRRQRSASSGAWARTSRTTGQQPLRAPRCCCRAPSPPTRLPHTSRYNMVRVLDTGTDDAFAAIAGRNFFNDCAFAGVSSPASSHCVLKHPPFGNIQSTCSRSATRLAWL